MKKGKFGLVGIGLVAINAALGFCLAGDLFLNVASADYVINEGSYFEAEDSGHMYKCYTIQGEPTSIAIAWLRSETNIVPTTLTIPSTITSNALTGSNVDYSVVAVAKGGFRYCNFETINLPTSITEIREEAFAYCQSMTTFTFPNGITEIAPSTFLDCRALTTIYFKNSAGNRVLANNTITRIGDHAFDSCVSLQNFYCPTKVTYFGNSCFQKCNSLLNFNLPNNTGSNNITIKSFAFADCDSLNSVYFEENLTTVEDYAFADSKSELRFKYTGSSIPTFSPKWRHKLIRTNSDEVYDVDLKQSKIVQHPDYPGLFYTIDSEAVKLDNARTNPTSIYVIEPNSGAYASIYEFHAPFDSQAGYWDKDNGILTIPNVIRVDDVDYTVKVIKANAFAANSSIQHVIFNKDLMQIQNHAFFNDTNIHTLDFTACTELVEISYSIFQEVALKQEAAENHPENADSKSDALGADQQTYNSVMTSITLPNCLQYIGNFAFYNFINLVDGISFKTDDTQPSQLKMIGDYAFAVHDGKNFTPSKAEVDLVLPNSLDDSAAPLAKFFHSFTYQKPGSGTINDSIQNRYAVCKNAFDNQRVLRTVTMEEANNGLSCSFATNVFIRCNKIITFRSNSNLHLMGSDIFKNCESLKEVFLCSDRAEAGDYDYPWGISDTATSKTNSNSYGGSLFMGTQTKPDLVIYVNGPRAPRKLTTAPKAGTNAWNIEAGNSFINELNYQANETYGAIRTRIPTFYNIDWQNEDGDDVVYWKKTNSENTYDCDKPSSVDDYKSGIIAIVKNKTTNKYTVAKYYTDGKKVGSVYHYSDEIDLTSIPIANDIDIIGDEAFGTDSGGHNAGLYFILPSSVTKIGERAFYRRGSVTSSARIVTYKSSGTAVVPTGESRTYAQMKSQAAYYCCLPPSVQRIERNAFYNNVFQKIELGASVNYIGSAAFYTHTTVNNNIPTALRGTVESITFIGSNSTFSAIGNGIYYTANAAKKTLLYQANGITGALSIDSGTVAIGFRAVASTQYSSVAFPNSLTTIYGCAFKNCINLTEITGLSSIQYINAFPTSTSDEVYNTSLPFDNYDFRDQSRAETAIDYTSPARFGAFQNCTSLTTVNFTTMTSLKKIGWYAFGGCSALSNCANNTPYNFYGTSTSNPTTVTTGVLDLRNCSSLTHVEKDAFAGCTSITYCITPNSTGTNHNAESTLYFGKDTARSSKEAGRPFPTSWKVLCGETHAQADQNGTSGLKPTTHYPTIKVSGVNQNYIANYTNLYYRVYSTSDLYGDSSATSRKYWTVTTSGDIYLFERNSEAIAWYDVPGNSASQLDH